MSLDSVARGLLRAAFSGRTIRRRLPKSVGGAIVYVAPDSQLKYLLPGITGARPGPDHTGRNVMPRSNDVVWDIGANCGVFAMAAAGLGAQVLAVEPDPFLANALVRARAANPGLRLEVLAAAIDDKSGIGTLGVRRRRPRLERPQGLRRQLCAVRPIHGTHADPTLRLDDLLAISVPTVVKIDIEGAEVIALRGATKLLAEVRPTLIVEVDLSLVGRGEVCAGGRRLSSLRSRRSGSCRHRPIVQCAGETTMTHKACPAEPAPSISMRTNSRKIAER